MSTAFPTSPRTLRHLLTLFAFTLPFAGMLRAAPDYSAYDVELRLQRCLHRPTLFVSQAAGALATDDLPPCEKDALSTWLTARGLHAIWEDDVVLIMNGLSQTGVSWTDVSFHPPIQGPSHQEELNSGAEPDIYGYVPVRRRLSDSELQSLGSWILQNLPMPPVDRPMYCGSCGHPPNLSPINFEIVLEGVTFSKNGAEHIVGRLNSGFATRIFLAQTWDGTPHLEWISPLIARVEQIDYRDVNADGVADIWLRSTLLQYRATQVNGYSIFEIDGNNLTQEAGDCDSAGPQLNKRFQDLPFACPVTASDIEAHVEEEDGTVSLEAPQNFEYREEPTRFYKFDGQKYVLDQPKSKRNASSVAQRNSSNPADYRGLLLGLYFPNRPAIDWKALAGEEWAGERSSGSRGRYLTFWISRKDHGVSIEAIKGLLVPRKNGFWQVGMQLITTGRPDESTFDEQMFAGPVGPGFWPAFEVNPDLRELGQSSRVITYVGPEYAAYLNYFQGPPGKFSYLHPGVVSLDAVDEDLPLATVLGQAANTEYEQHAKSEDHMSEPVDGPCRCCISGPKEWGIRHVGDSWKAHMVLREGTSSSCATNAHEYEMREPLPKSLTSGASPSDSFDDLRTQAAQLLKVPPETIHHFFVSPRRDLLVTLTENGIAVLSSDGLKLTSLLKLQPFQSPCIPVMEQWSVGKYVASWDQTVRQERPASLPARAVRVTNLNSPDTSQDR